VLSNFSKCLFEEFRRAIGHDVLFGKSWRAIYQYHQLRNAFDSRQIADRCVKCPQKIDGHGTGSLLALCRREIGAELANPWFAVDLGDVTR
jgi:hypothetical protein